MAFFSKADAKVRTFSEPPKLFGRNFQKKSFFSGGSRPSSLFQYFNSSAFLSRKRVQNYCFTAYHPNILNTFLLKICTLLLNLLVFKSKKRTVTRQWFLPENPPLPYYLLRARTQKSYTTPLHPLHNKKHLPSFPKDRHLLRKDHDLFSKRPDVFWKRLDVLTKTSKRLSVQNLKQIPYRWRGWRVETPTFIV